MPAEAVPTLRCYDAQAALRLLAALFGVTGDRIAAALPRAAKTALADTLAPNPAHLIVEALAADRGRSRSPRAGSGTSTAPVPSIRSNSSSGASCRSPTQTRGPNDCLRGRGGRRARAALAPFSYPFGGLGAR